MTIFAMLISLSAATAAGSAQLDAEPLPRYLDEEVVLPVFHGASPAFADCFSLHPLAVDAPPQPIRLHVAIGASGAVVASTASADRPLPEGLASCLEQAGRALDFPAHDLQQERWSYTVLRTQGKVQAYPSVQRASRASVPLFLRFPLDMPPEARLALRELLGFDPSAPESTTNPKP